MDYLHIHDVEQHRAVKPWEAGIFRYKESLDEDYIRVIELLPGSEHDVVRCNLTLERRGDTKDTYAAISYTWGSPEVTKDIICCGETLPITINLVSALRAIRSKSPQTAQRVWADAICIDQQSNEEKNHQVRQIGHVYENASHVIVWLGYDEDGIAPDCFGLIEKWNLYLGKQLAIRKHPRDFITFEPPPLVCDDPERGLKLGKLFELPWFKRVWVVQEAALAKDCHLFWGDHVIKFEELMEFACFCTGRTDLKKLIGGGNYLDIDLWQSAFRCVYCTYQNEITWRCNKPLINYYFQKHDAKKPGLFLDILQIGKSLLASDPRDHIYAFSGNPLAFAGKGTLLLEPDYGQENDEGKVYFELACALLKSRESPYVLCFVQHHSAEAVMGSEGPSWVPKWKKPLVEMEPHMINLFTIGNIGIGQMTGGPADKLVYDVYHNFDTFKPRLTLRGIEFDHIIWTSELLKHGNLALDPDQWDAENKISRRTYIEALWRTVSIAFEQYKGFLKPLAHVRYYDDFSLTLVAGYKNGRSSKSSKHRPVFKAYLKALDRVFNLEKEMEISPLSETESSNAYRYEMDTRICGGRRLAITKAGRFALVPQFAEVGDACYVLLGMLTPFVLRSAATKNEMQHCFHLVGEAYVKDVMKGELAEELDSGIRSSVEITLI